MMTERKFRDQEVQIARYRVLEREVTDPQRRRSLLNFAIVGAGPTGVELAGIGEQLAVWQPALDVAECVEGRLDERRVRHDECVQCCARRHRSGVCSDKLAREAQEGATTWSGERQVSH